MTIENFPFTKIYSRIETNHNISLIFFNSRNPSEALVFMRFNFYLINSPDEINLKDFVCLLPEKEKVSGSNEQFLSIEKATATDINDIVYIKLSNSLLIVLTYTVDNYTGDSYQNIRIFAERNSSQLSPLKVTEYEKFNLDMENEKPVDVLDLRFK